MGYDRFGPVLAMGIVLMIIVSIQVSAQRPTPSQCSRERQQGIDNCKEMIFGKPPSAACCRVIRTGHYECACPAIDAKLAALLDVKKVSKILRDCGRAVPRRFKCGSLYFP
ncbi:uncharacterized protein LOC124942393 isoform X2 [Impatiens glandulifera]|uniref:uncharacterized protein LOC124942393 isoform X1 n=1 Tax=Impatiens glandulifera TaxID=253017 RepID=UPI001FB18D84|nr:uncharacterized protein LOC124942393 isoform X1 [Impatiens glandulifera]XP_047338851.1 uncharacterized protein LOC124942393 isoform X2 [Impatiens glandulifera]